MKPIKLTLLALVMVLGITKAKAQAGYFSFGSGRPVQESDYVNVVGTPYLFDKWQQGTVAFADNKLAENIMLKYNAKDDEVYFKNDKDEAMRFQDPITSFTIRNETGSHVFRNGFKGSSLVSDKAYLEVIAPGKAQFLKRSSKSIAESKEYATGNVERRFLDVNKYFVYSSDKLTEVKRDPKDILAAIGDKQTELSKYIKDNKLNLKNDADVVKLMSYYDKL